jgi:hypothetical protein
MNQHNVVTISKTYVPTLVSKENEVVVNNETYVPSLDSKQYDVPQEGYYDYLPIYYAYLKRVTYLESAICIKNKLYNLSKNI